MTTSTKIIIGIFIIALIGGCIWYSKQKPTSTPTADMAQTTDVTGCYVARLAKDVYTLNIQGQEGSEIFGTLWFKNFEKDSSIGTFKGTLEEGILKADYTFASEGMDSIMEVIFKKTDTGFIRGYGETEMDGDRVVFKNIKNVEYDPQQDFKAEACQ